MHLIVLCEDDLMEVNLTKRIKLKFKIKTCIFVELKNKIQLDATYYFIMLMLGSTCFGHHYAHHQELTTIALVTTEAVWFSSCCWLEVKCRHDG